MIKIKKPNWGSILSFIVTAIVFFILATYIYGCGYTQGYKKGLKKGSEIMLDAFKEVHKQVNDTTK